MTKRSKRTWGGLLLLLVPLVCLGAEVSQRVEKTFETTLNPRIRLSNLTGQVIVKGWEKSQVRTVWTSTSPHVELDTEVLPPSGPAEKIHFTTHVLDPLAAGQSQAADYTLEVPQGSSLEIRNRQGSVQVEGLQGETWVESVDGPISATSVAGRLAVRSVGGNIELIRPSGHVEATSITGNLHFVEPTSRKLQGRTTSGRILYEGDFAPGADYLLSAYGGDIDILCPPSASFELSAKTIRGKVQNSLPFTPKRRTAAPFSSASNLFGLHHAGNATLELTSFSGTIRIRAR